jgi:hypothetical protein
VHTQFSAFSGCAECPNATRVLDFYKYGASSARAERPLFLVAAIRGGLEYFFNQLANSPKVSQSTQTIKKGADAIAGYGNGGLPEGCRERPHATRLQMDASNGRSSQAVACIDWESAGPACGMYLAWWLMARVGRSRSGVASIRRNTSRIDVAVYSLHSSLWPAATAAPGASGRAAQPPGPALDAGWHCPPCQPPSSRASHALCPLD